jgi:hypothetical protein
METFKAYLLIVGFVGVLGAGGYWAATSLKDPVRIAETEEIKIVAQTPVSSTDTPSQPVVEEPVVVPETPSTSETPASGEHSALITALQKLITDNVLMKEGSRGTRVGTVQQFLNVYNKTSGGLDNDYGPGTKTKVAAFQKAVGLTADGQAGPATYQKMIDWLKTNG